MIRPDLLGLSFHLAWMCLFMYDVLPGFMEVGGESFDVLNPIYFFSMLSLVATFAFGILRTRAFMRAARSKALAVAAPLACSAGTLCYTLTALGAVPDPQTPLLVAGGVLTGAASAVMAAHWASVFGRAQARAVILNFALILASVVVICLVAAYLSPVAALGLATLLPLASGACLAHADARGRSAGRTTSQPRGRTRNRGAYAVLIAAVGLLGFSAGCLPRLSRGDYSFDGIFYILNSLLVLAAVGWIVIQEERRAFPALFAAPVVALVVFALPFVRFTENTVADVFYIMGNASIELMLLFASVLLALLFDLSCARAFMVARVTMALSDFAGALLAGLILARGSSVGVQLAGGAVFAGSEVVMGALLVIYLLIRKRSLPTPELNRQAAGVEGGKAEQAAETGATQRAGGAEAVPAAGAEPAATPGDAVHAAVERYALSPREADVLALLVEGDTGAQIQDKLCIAPGTFNYHMRNIYAKLGVHSRQELLVSIYNQDKQ